MKIPTGFMVKVKITSKLNRKIERFFRNLFKRKKQ